MPIAWRKLDKTESIPGKGFQLLLRSKSSRFLRAGSAKLCIFV